MAQRSSRTGQVRVPQDEDSFLAKDRSSETSDFFCFVHKPLQRTFSFYEGYSHKRRRASVCLFIHSRRPSHVQRDIIEQPECLIWNFFLESFSPRNVGLEDASQLAPTLAILTEKGKGRIEERESENIPCGKDLRCSGERACGRRQSIKKNRSEFFGIVESSPRSLFSFSFFFFNNQPEKKRSFKDFPSYSIKKNKCEANASRYADNSIRTVIYTKVYYNHGIKK